MNLYEKVFRALNQARIKYLVVGGVAVNLYGYRRFTGDIDILLALDESNLQKMSGVMKKFGYIERLPVALHELSDTKKVKQWMQEKGMTAYTFISNISEPQLDIDIVVSDSFDFQKFFQRKGLIEIWGIKVPVISLNDLIVMKKRAKRDKDLLDIKALLELKQL